MEATTATGVTLPPLRWMESPNFSDRAAGVPLDLIVVHDTEGGYDSACSWFANRHSQVSAHIVLKENASEATQMVPYSKKAWHCMTFNSRSIGLEMAGFAKAGYGEHEWAVAARIVAFLLHTHGLRVRWARDGQGGGFCRHYDLGAAGGGHHDPTTDDHVWERFVHRVEAEIERGGFRPEWGRA